MKNNPFTLPALLVFALWSCAGEPANPDPLELDWSLNAEQVCKSQTIKTENSQMLHLQFQTGSLCPDSGVRVVLSADGIEYYNFLIEAFPHDQNLDLPDNTVVSLSTCIEQINEESICVWLGQVECLMSY